MKIVEFVLLISSCSAGAEIAPPGSEEAANGCGTYMHVASFYGYDRSFSEKMCLRTMQEIRKDVGYYHKTKSGEVVAVKMACMDERDVP